MKDKMEGGYAVGRAIKTSLVLAVFFLLASGANATVWDVPGDGPDIQYVLDNLAGADDTIVVHHDTYAQDLLVNISPITIKGIDNPVLTNGSPGGNVITIYSPEVTITGFTIKGTTAAGILVNDSPEIGNPLVVYNNIIENGIGFQNDYSGSDWEADPVLNFWGQYGTDANRGRPGWGSGSHVNNDVSPSSVHYNPWLTSEVIDGNVTNALEQYPDCDGIDQLILENEEAGINIELSDGSLKFDPQLGVTSMGSALYNSSPYLSTHVPGTAIKYFNVFIKHYEGPVGKASVDISYDSADTSSILEDTLKPYVLVGSHWQAATDVVVDEDSHTVHGTFPTFPDHWAYGSIIALVGQTYKVTIVPPQDPSTPIQDKPVFTTFTIESAVDDISEVYYQLDGHGSSGWIPIDTGYSGTTWDGAPWSVSDSDWANVTNASHTFYFKFVTTSSEVGDNGNISWQFTKGGEVPPVSPVQVISPRAGQKLSRSPTQIKWTLPSEEDIDSIDLWFARDGDFNMNGGLNNPLHIATLGGGTTYTWRSPNFQTDIAKILVVVTYLDGTEYYGLSENFSLVKGYSFKAYKPAPKPVYNIGSGVSQGIAIIGSWFHKPRLPFIIG
jgi:hypothetical protein